MFQLFSLLLQMEELKAGLSNKEYQIITECALDNYSESPDIVPPLMDSVSPTIRIEDAVVPPVSEPESTAPDGRTWVTTKVYVVIDLVELRLHAGTTRDAPLATVQVIELLFCPWENMFLMQCNRFFIQR